MQVPPCGRAPHGASPPRKLSPLRLLDCVTWESLFPQDSLFLGTERSRGPPGPANAAAGAPNPPLSFTCSLCVSAFSLRTQKCGRSAPEAQCCTHACLPGSRTRSSEIHWAATTWEAPSEMSRQTASTWVRCLFPLSSGWWLKTTRTPCLMVLVLRRLESRWRRAGSSRWPRGRVRFLPSPASGGCLDSLARGPFLHLQSTPPNLLCLIPDFPASLLQGPL